MADTDALLEMQRRLGGGDSSQIFATPTGPTGPVAIDPLIPPSTIGVAPQVLPRPAEVEGGTPGYQDYRNALYRHEQSLKDAENYATLAKRVFDINHEASQHAAAGDFLSEFIHLDQHDPNYEQKFTALMAKHPDAAGHAAVQDAITTKHAARQIQLGVSKTGGENEFEQGTPERNAYQDAFTASNGDAAVARAAAQNTATGEKMVREGLANGLIKDSDWDNPDLYHDTKQGAPAKLNYHAIGLLMAQRANEVSGKGYKAETQDVQNARQLLTSLAPRIKALADSDTPEDKAKLTDYLELHDNAMKTLLNASRTNPAPNSSPTSKRVQQLIPQ